MINQKITVDLIPGKTLPSINISQYDTGYESVFVSLTWQNSAYVIAEGTAVQIEGEKTDGTGFAVDCNWDNYIVTVPITAEMTDTVGEVYCKLVLKKDDNQVSSAPFILNISKAPVQKGGTGGGSGEGNGDRAATDEEIADLIGGLDL